MKSKFFGLMCAVVLIAGCATSRGPARDKNYLLHVAGLPAPMSVRNVDYQPDGSICYDLAVTGARDCMKVGMYVLESSNVE